MSEPRPIAIRKLVTSKELSSWRTLWIEADGPVLDVPLAAFIRRPDLLRMERGQPRHKLSVRRSETPHCGAFIDGECNDLLTTEEHEPWL